MSATELNWFKSSYSDSSNPSLIHVRDSKTAAQGPRLTLAPTTWAEFISYASGS